MADAPTSITPTAGAAPLPALLSHLARRDPIARCRNPADRRRHIALLAPAGGKELQQAELIG